LGFIKPSSLYWLYQAAQRLCTRAQSHQQARSAPLHARVMPSTGALSAAARACKAINRRAQRRCTRAQSHQQARSAPLHARDAIK
jgi:cob(I)alamin adenosyltransferase